DDADVGAEVARQRAEDRDQGLESAGRAADHEHVSLPLHSHGKCVSTISRSFATACRDRARLLGLGATPGVFARRSSSAEMSPRRMIALQIVSSSRSRFAAINVSRANA